jgi:hypothetical protein
MRAAFLVSGGFGMSLFLNASYVMINQTVNFIKLTIKEAI